MIKGRPSAKEQKDKEALVKKGVGDKLQKIDIPETTNIDRTGEVGLGANLVFKCGQIQVCPQKGRKGGFPGKPT